jgi:hypoxanthine phosphoribosyltransferase
MSDSDIPAGARWQLELIRHLKSTEFAVLCLTPENINSHWILYEAGALSRSLESQISIVPYLYEVEIERVPPPIKQFQCTLADKPGTRRLVDGIAAALDDKDTRGRISSRRFDDWYEVFRLQLKEIPHGEMQEDPKAVYPWRNIMVALQKIIPKILDRRPDVLIGIGNGMVTASMLAVNMESVVCYCLNMPVRRDEDKSRVATIIGEIGDLTDKNVIIVDNHIYTGTNTKAALDFVKSKGPKSVTTAVLFKHQDVPSVIEPDIWICEEKTVPMTVPWSFTEVHRRGYGKGVFGKK